MKPISSQAGVPESPVAILAQLVVPSRDSLAALYRPPFVFMFQGTFEQVQPFKPEQGIWVLQYDVCKFGLLNCLQS
jgi:hypothetical protein